VTAVDPAHPDLDTLAALARSAGVLGIDTEFISEGRYRAMLCLVQAAVPDPAADGGTRVVLIDPLARTPAVQPGALATLLADPDIEVVLHAGRQDVAILRRVWGAQVTSVFDTQIAAGFAGSGAQVGYGTLLADVLGMHLSKSAGFTRWDLRPLTAEQIGYAIDDVAHLLDLAEALRQRLRDSGRLAWVRQECARVEQASDERDPDSAWERLPRVHQLSGRARAVAQALAAWREHTAAREDRPLGSILPDQTLLELARRQPGDAAGLERIRGLQPSTQRRRGTDLLAVVQQGLRARPPAPREHERLDLRPGDVPLIALGEALVRSRAATAGLAYELVASRSDLEQVITAARRGDPEPDVRTLQGWRRELVGTELLDLLAGRRLLGVDAGGQLVVHDTAGDGAGPPRSAAGDIQRVGAGGPVDREPGPD
jgi:ribonuclease D